MSRPPHARESVLDAFQTILIDEGARAATMDAIARAAGVSKGGLLYHFASKDALEAGMIERMWRLAEEDARNIASSPAGPIEAYIRASLDAGSALDRAIIAVSRLAQQGSPAAARALRRVRELWEEAVRPAVTSTAALQLIMLVGDGLYFNNALPAAVPGPVPTGAELDALVALVLAAAADR